MSLPSLPPLSRTPASEEPTLSSESPAGPPRFPAQTRDSPDVQAGLRRFNTAPAETVHAALLTCCGSRRWATRLVAHRPYPDLDALLAAADEAGYDLALADLAEALAAESSSGPVHTAPPAARTALRAAHAAYESSFGHAFVISLEGHRPEEHLDHVLAGLRARLPHDPDEERSVSADQLRRLARTRIAYLVAHQLDWPSTGPAVPQVSR
ncbi:MULTISPECIES: 2-oxo-4-hydroxy-4-carboxy-5-ureidoimidazoline decarboxylase [unclassified Streptomyces]|uniref:2-oxo-4-hydroxy-4-carboxy-5-ureidoimidazoline decarboxylase n=1 Tax=unclassified Streptomyces TaxID=2593676 RepID=UPI000AA6C35F|nr:2-oxo-4-hydroxy-4-carboxy-5-ureidoimidazoline decarboxylase [Streptomyces sp. NBC_00370]